MSAIVVDLKDMGVRTPEQLVRVFYSTYDPESVRIGLWEAFRGFALAVENLQEKELPGIKETALLFDGLIGLASAVYDLQDKTIGRCVICGRSDDSHSDANEEGNDNDGLNNAG